jgi:hypothetical protein
MARDLRTPLPVAGNVFTIGSFMAFSLERRKWEGNESSFSEMSLIQRFTMGKHIGLPPLVKPPAMEVKGVFQRFR